MEITLSITNRNQVYFPEALQKALKIKRPGKFKLKINNDCVKVEPVKDIFELIGSLKDKAAPADFDFNKYFEDNYERP